MTNLLTRLRASVGYQRSGSLNCAVQLRAYTSQFILDIDQLIAELEKSQSLYCIQQHYGCIVAIACKIFNFIGRYL